MTFAHVYSAVNMKEIQMKKTQSHIIKKRTNNKVSFVEFITQNHDHGFSTTKVPGSLDFRGLLSDCVGYR